MNDLERSELERRLLEAGRSETVPPELRAQMARALDGVAPAATVRASLSWASAKLLVPVAASVIGLSGAAWYAMQHARRTQPTAAVVTHAAPAAAVSASAPPPTAANDPDALGAEVALLDRARGALREHEGARAVAILSEYQQHFARGVLRPEAEVLQIEALMQRGSAAKARQLAQRFIAEHPAHPLSDRVQRLLVNAR